MSIFSDNLNEEEFEMACVRMNNEDRYDQDHLYDEEEVDDREYDELPPYVNRIPIMDALIKEQGKAVLKHRKEYAMGLLFAQKLLMDAEGKE